MFTTASELLKASKSNADPAYNVTLASAAGDLVVSTSGVELNSKSIHAAASKMIDTSLIADSRG